MNIIITGASRGIGFETLRNIAVSGEHKILAISRSIENIKDSLKYFVNNKSQIELLAIDLETDFDLFEKIDNVFKLSEGNKIDILINNAATIIVKKFEDLEISDWQKMFNLNVLAAANLIRILYPYFSRKDAHIVNIGSMGGFQGSEKFEGLAGYSASKAAIINMTESLAVAMIKRGVSVNAIAPGAVQTDMLAQAFPGFKAKIKPEQMGKFIADFALNSGKLMNGKVVPVSLVG